MDNITFDLDNFPEDAVAVSGATKVYEPIDPSEMYQVEASKVSLKQNPYWKPADPAKGEKDNMLSKYQISFEFTILDEGKFYGRRIWDNAYLSLKPVAKGGAPTKLYKIVSKAMKTTLDQQQCIDLSPTAKDLFANVLKNVQGKQLRVSIENVTKNDKTRTKIVAYNEAKQTLPPYDQTKVAQS